MQSNMLLIYLMREKNDTHEYINQEAIWFITSLLKAKAEVHSEVLRQKRHRELIQRLRTGTKWEDKEKGITETHSLHQSS